MGICEIKKKLINAPPPPLIWTEKYFYIISKYTYQMQIRRIFMKHICLSDVENNISLSAIKIMKLIYESASF